MADPQTSKHNSSPLSDKRLKYLTATLLQWIIKPQQALASSAKIHVSYVKIERNRWSEQLARKSGSKVTLELVRKIKGVPQM